MDLSVKLTVQSKQLLNECNRYKREEASAATQLKQAARRGNDAEVMMAATKQVNATRMHSLYSRLAVQLSHVAGLVRTAAITGRVTETLSRVTAQLSSAASSMDSSLIERRLSEFNAAMGGASQATTRMESALGALGGSCNDEDVKTLIMRASEEVGIELCAQFVRPPQAFPVFDVDDAELLADCKPPAL
jgi:hypothetical protein